MQAKAPAAFARPDQALTDPGALQMLQRTWPNGRVSLRVGTGQVLALVGVSGAGKSTIARLLLRFYDPDDGTVTVDDVDLRELRFDDLRRNIAVVLQETLVFDCCNGPATTRACTSHRASRATDGTGSPTSRRSRTVRRPTIRKKERCTHGRSASDRSQRGPN